MMKWSTVSRNLILVVGLALPLNAVVQAEEPAELKIGSFSTSPDRPATRPNVEVDVMLVIEVGNVRHIRLDRRITEASGKSVTSVADSRSCTLVMERLSLLEDLPMPKIVLPGSDKTKRTPIVLGGSFYKIDMSGHESLSDTTSEIELTARSGSPLGRWTEETLDALEPCWSDTET